MTNTFTYGMRLRGFAPGCQPLDGLIESNDDPSGKYHSILTYNRQLTPDELTEYELDDLTANERAMLELLDAFSDILKSSTGKDIHEIINAGVTAGWHVLPGDPPPEGGDVILQYRTKTGDIRTIISRWSGKYWSGKIYHPQAWHEMPQPYMVPITDGEEDA